MKRGKFFIVLGLLFLLGAAGLTLYNLWDTSRAGKASDALLEQFEEVAVKQYPDYSPEKIPDYKLDPTMAMPTVEIDGREYCGTISIPVLDRSFPVFNDWNYTKLKLGPCRFYGTAYMKNMVICAHNYTSHFGRLRNLSYGDMVVFTDAVGNEFRYNVIEIVTVNPNDVTDMITGSWDLTLFTCTLGGATRVTVRCQLDEEEPDLM